MVIIKDLEKLKDIRTYQPGEVYKVKDKYISMSRSEDSIQEDKNRYVLIVSSKELIKDRNSINVVSLTTSGAPDLYSYPLHKEFSDTADKFKPSEKSLALINFYQPIKKEYLEEYCGIIESDRYKVIALAICHNVVGVNIYDLVP